MTDLIKLFTVTKITNDGVYMKTPTGYTYCLGEGDTFHIDEEVFETLAELQEMIENNA